MNSKSLLTILITAIIVGGGVYLWQNRVSGTQQQLPVDSRPEAVSEEEAVVSETSSAINIVEVAKTSDASFLYLVTSPSYKETHVVLKNFLVNFSLEYSYGEWTKLYFSETDLTASDVGGSLNRFAGLVEYDFCAGGYFCDMENLDGKGFQLKVWNAKYNEKEDNPNFYLQDDEIFVAENDDVIITYKPYGGRNVEEAVAELFESFELIN